MIGLAAARNWRRRVLGQIDRRQQADRPRDRHRDHGDQQRAGEQRHRAEAARRADLVGADRGLRAPLQAEQEVRDRHALEEPDRFEQHREHDPGGDHDRDRRGQQQRRSRPSCSTRLRARKLRSMRPSPIAMPAPASASAADHERDRRDALELAPQIGRRAHRVVRLHVRRQTGRHPADVVEEEVQHRRRLLGDTCRQPAGDDPAQHQIAEQQPRPSQTASAGPAHSSATYQA